MACATTSSNIIPRIEITVKHFHSAWIVMEKLFVKWAQSNIITIVMASLYRGLVIIVNSLVPGRSGLNSKSAIFNLGLLIGIFGSSYDNAWRQQAITWANVDTDICYDVLPIDHNELNKIILSSSMNGIILCCKKLQWSRFSMSRITGLGTEVSPGLL